MWRRHVAAFALPAPWNCAMLAAAALAFVMHEQLRPRVSHGRPRLRSVRCGAAAELCEQRFGCTAAEALLVEQKAVAPTDEAVVTLSVAQQRADTLQARLSLSETQLKKVVTTFPSVLGVRETEPLLAKLQARLGLSEAELQKVVVGRPPVLGLSYEASLEPSLAKLQSRLSLSEAQLQRVVVALPQVLGMSYEAKLEPSLAKLQAKLEMDEAELRTVVVGRPQILGYSYEANLRPKLDFLQVELDLSRERLRELIVAKPARLSYSLDNRYKPRLKACRRCGADELRALRLAHKSDKAFCDLIGFPLQELEALRAPENGPWLAGATQKNSWGGFFLKEGFKLTLKACEQGSPNSLGMYKMAQMYELGIGTPVDMDKAAEWMRCSVRLSDPQSGARKARDWLAANGVET